MNIYTLKNTIKTTLLLSALTVLLMLIGFLYGGQGTMMIAFVFAIVMNVGSYWFSDKIVLKMYKAKEVTRSQAPELHQIVINLAKRANLPMPKVYIMDSPVPNAFATGRNPSHAAVAVTTSIMNLLSHDELEGVLAHELAHVKNRDTLISTIAATLAGVIMMVASMARWAAIFGGFGGRDSNGGGSQIIGLIFTAFVAPLAAVLIQMAISRSREYGADRGGAEISGKPQALASALARLESGVAAAHQSGRVGNINPSTAHMFIVNPLKGMTLGSLFSTHPPIPKRVERLNSMNDIRR